MSAGRFWSARSLLRAWMSAGRYWSARSLLRALAGGSLLPPRRSRLRNDPEGIKDGSPGSEERRPRVWDRAFLNTPTGCQNARGDRPKLGTYLFTLAILVLIGCGGGGGGGGGNATVTGRVVQVETGAAPNPTASVQIGSNSTFTDASDGSFQLDAPSGSTSITVDSRTQTSGLWIFSVPPISGVTDVGDLWIGPERVILTGTVRSSATNDPVSGATVTFGGRIGTTNASGVFSLADVAYSSATQVAFWGIPGTVRATGFFKADFSAAPNFAQGNPATVNVGDIFLVPTSDPNPPGPPYNIWGQVTAPGGPSGAIVRLKQGGIDVRVFNVSSDGRYFFFVLPGSYTIAAEKGASFAPPIDVTLTSPTEVIRRDITIP